MVNCKPLLLVCLLAATGCASGQAKSKAVDRPALVVPAPPARVIEPVALPPEPVSDLPNPTVTAPPSRPPRRETPPRPAANDPKTDPKPGETKPVELPPVETPPPPAATTAPVPQLSTPQTADAGAAARTVRATIDSAKGILNSVNFGPLSNERKKAYNDVKQFLQQAEDALKQGNLPFAQGVATKAETLAKELAGR